MAKYEIQVWIAPGVFERVVIEASNLRIATQLAERQTGGKVKGSRALPG